MKAGPLTKKIIIMRLTNCRCEAARVRACPINHSKTLIILPFGRRLQGQGPVRSLNDGKYIYNATFQPSP